MKKQNISQRLRRILQSITHKRARVVIDHILKYGFITTEQLKKYGYDHPPRAARDVREQGIPLETFKVKASNGRSIAAYRFGDLSKIEHGKFGGRSAFSKDFKTQLYEISEGRCGICRGRFESRYLQIDHRIPYEVLGEGAKLTRQLEEYMLLDGSCNRAKSWSCEHCVNWQAEKNPDLCLTCYWASPENYNHIALQEARRLDILWTGDEVKIYDGLKELVSESRIPLPDFVKQIIERYAKSQE